MIKMSINYKILLNYIKDLSVENTNAESFIIARENISKYSLDIDISSKAIKNKMIEIYTKLIFHDKRNTKKKSHFEMVYATVVQINDEKPNKDELKKLLLCDIQIEIFPKLENAFVEVLKHSGFENLRLKGKIDFDKLYKQKLS
tara:strand:- start:2694 stop:3125 length:432 start_codon:yes stop_codon:yes gene_type:complete